MSPLKYEKLLMTQKTHGTEVCPIVFLRIFPLLKENRLFKALLDTGASSTLIKKDLIPQKLLKADSQMVKWTTAAGNFKTNYKVEITFNMPELSKSKIYTWQTHVLNHGMLSNYDIILGRDFMQEAGIKIDFETNQLSNEDGELPLREPSTKEIYLLSEEPQKVQEAQNRFDRIIAANYEKADLKQIVSKAEHLTSEMKQQLYRLLKKFETLFDGTLGKLKNFQYEIELKDGAKPYHAKPYNIPQALTALLKKN